MSDESMDNVNLVKNLYDAFSRGDVSTVLGGMSPDIHWHQAESNPYRPSGEAWIGPKSMQNNLFMRLDTEWERFAIHPKLFHDAGGSVIVEARYSGT
jgi:uncharacterized protein